MSIENFIFIFITDSTIKKMHLNVSDFTLHFELYNFSIIILSNISVIFIYFFTVIFKVKIFIVNKPTPMIGKLSIKLSIVLI